MMPDHALPQLIAPRDRVLRERGRAGMGVANASPETVERFKREARAPAKIKSEHVVKVTDAVDRGAEARTLVRAGGVRDNLMIGRTR